MYWRRACFGRHPATVSPSVLTVACWNIRHLRIQTDEDGTTPRKTNIIDLELNRLNIDIATLSETWLTGNGSIREEHYTFFWSGHPEGERMRHGVGIAVRNCLMTCIEHPRNLSQRLMSMRVPITQRCLTVLSAYAPTLKACSEEKDEFYQLLSESLSTISKGDDLVLAGDFNTRVGAEYDQWNGALGHHCLGKMNENGQRLLELCTNYNLALTYTFFAGSLNSKLTWMHPRYRCWHQLDHIVVRCRQLNSVKHSRSMHSANCGTDHALVRSKLLVAPCKFFRSSTKCSPSINTAAMKNDSSTSLFKSLLSVKAMPDYPGTNVEDAWSKFRSLVMGSAVSAFGRRQKRQPNWFRESANVLIPAVEARREARLQLKTQNTRAAKAILLTAKANVQWLFRAALRDFWTKITTEVQRCSEVGDLRGVYNGIESTENHSQ